MSCTFTLSGKSSNLTAQFSPPIDLDEGDEYSLGLINFEAYNSIPNIDATNNYIYYDSDDKFIKIPEGSYEIEDINHYIKKRFAVDHGNDSSISITSNKNTLKVEVKSNKIVNFEKAGGIGSLLGFTSRVLKPFVRHISDFPAKIQKVNAICVQCNLVTGSFMNDKSVHIIHEFFPSVPPGYKIIECPANVIYLPINKRRIDSLSIKIVDQDGDLVNFRGEVITVRLHLKKNGS